MNPELLQKVTDDIRELVPPGTSEKAIAGAAEILADAIEKVVANHNAEQGTTGTTA